MSGEVVAVLPGSDLPDRMRWQDAIIKRGLPWRFEASVDPSATKRFCPMQAETVASGVEILHGTLEALPGHLPIETSHRVVVFRWAATCWNALARSASQRAEALAENS